MSARIILPVARGLTAVEDVHRGGNVANTENTRPLEGAHLEARVVSEIRKIVECHGASWVNINGAAILPYASKRQQRHKRKKHEISRRC